MKVVHLASTHALHDTRIFVKECRALADTGYQVVLIVPHDRTESSDGVELRPVTLPNSRLERMTRVMGQIFRAAWKERAAAYHFHDPELIPIGLLLKLRGSRVVYDVHEDAPRTMLSKSWIPPVLRKPAERLMAAIERMAVRWVDGVVAATPLIATRFPPDKTAVVQNFPRVEEIAFGTGVPFDQREDRIVYVGAVTEIRGAREMVRAMAKLPSDSAARLQIAGVCHPVSLESELRGLQGGERLDLLGWLPRSGVVELLGSARIGLVLLHPVPNYLESYPTKMFEYMSAGLPVVASDFPVWREIVESAGCGLLVDPFDTAAIAGAIEWLLAHPAEAETMGRRGEQAARDRYNWESEAPKLLALYDRLLGGPGSAKKVRE